MNMASSSSSAVILPQRKYDVFLSFRGPDTRQTFTSHLYAALNQRKINTYMDDKLERGDEIGPALMKAIEQSKLAIIILSEQYATSRWCLDELVYILECKKRYGQLVVPVFYGIAPSHVRSMSNMDKIRGDALSTAANLSGFVSETVRNEAELVEAIVTDILAKLNFSSSTIVKGLVGFEAQIETIESLLCVGVEDVKFRLVGIWGMGGIGKTTLADAVYHRHTFEFDSCIFLPNIREDSEKQEIYNLRSKLIRKLLKDESVSIDDSPSLGPISVLTQLSQTKVLVVLDDVNDSSQLESLLGEQVVFGSGSRVIITSRNKRLLMEKVNDHHIYQVMKLNFEDALKLFLKAFQDGASNADYSDVSRKVVKYAGGVPLVLKVLGSLFRHCNSKQDCEDKLKILKEFPNKRIQGVLRASYYGLEEHEKEIFLDIACFFKGWKIHEAKRMMEMHGFCAPQQGIQVLIDMSLVSISKDDHLEMHDVLQELGMTIVCEQCTSDPGRRSRLWNVEDVTSVLENDTGSATVEAIFVDMSKVQDLKLSCTAFRNMHNLRLLKLVQLRSPEASKACLVQGLKTLPDNLRYLHWYGYCYKYFPSEFTPRRLVELHMPRSLVQKLWENGKNLESLKVIDLSNSTRLSEVPDLSQSPNVEEINFSGCTSLVQVPSYFKSLYKLTSLNLSRCKKLKTLPGIPCSLRFFNMSYCTELTKVPDLSHCQNIENINLACTSLVEVPLFFQHLDKLTSLNLARCLKLEYLPEIPCNSLMHRTLQSLDLSGTMIKTLPGGIKHVSGLRILKLSNCKKLESLPELPTLLEMLKANDCTSLTTVAKSRTTGQQYEDPHYRAECYMFTGSVNLNKSSRSNIMDDALLRSIQMASSKIAKTRNPDGSATEDSVPVIYPRSRMASLPRCLARESREDSITIIYPGNEIPEWFSYRAQGSKVKIECFPCLFNTIDFVGFLCAAVIASKLSNIELWCYCRYETKNGKSYHESVRAPLRLYSTEAHHVLAFFTKGEGSGVRPRTPIPFNEITKAYFEFHGTVACGINLLYSQDSGRSSSRTSYMDAMNLWNSDQNLGKLKVIDLSYCENVRAIPDLSQCPNIERLNLLGCTSLVRVQSCIKDLDLLTDLNLGGCSDLYFLEVPCNIQSLELSHCEKLTQVPDLSQCSNIERINLSWCTSLVEAPSSFQNLDKLTSLDLRCCSNLKTLSKIPCNMVFLDLSHCEKLTQVPDLSQCSNIERINLSWCTSLVEAPSSFQNLDKLASLDLGCCSNLKTLSKIPCNMVFLDLSHCEKLTQVPDLSQCSNIERINLSWCTSLVEIPSYFQNLDKLTSLDLRCCSNLKTLPKIPCNMVFLDLSQCSSLEFVQGGTFPKNCLESLKLRGCSKLKTLPVSLVDLWSALKKLDLSHCNMLSIPDRLNSLSSLQDMDLEGSLIESIPKSIKNAHGLRTLNLKDCKNLQCIPELPLLLECLDADGCRSLKVVSSSVVAGILDGRQYQSEYPYYRKQHLIFTNCVQLDESAKSNILGDAQIRIMQVASSRLAKRIGPYGSAAEDSVTVVYPGYQIPSWFDYQMEGCSIKVEFPQCWFHTAFLGFALSCVVAFHGLPSTSDLHLYELRSECNFVTNDGVAYQDLFTTPPMRVGPNEAATSISTDNVLMFFNNRTHSNEGNNPVAFNKVTEASFRFYSDHRSVKVKRCGIRMLYTNDSGALSLVNKELILLGGADEALVKDRSGPDQIDNIRGKFEELEDPMEYEEALDFKCPWTTSTDSEESENEFTENSKRFTILKRKRRDEEDRFTSLSKKIG